MNRSKRVSTTLTAKFSKDRYRKYAVRFFISVLLCTIVIGFVCKNRILGYAASGGNLTLVKVLVALGADPNYDCYDGFTPVYYAADYREVLHFLHTQGGNLEAENELRGTPLETVASDGDLKGVQNLIAEGANVNDNVTATSSVGSALWQVRHKNDDVPTTGPLSQYRVPTNQDAQIIEALKRAGAKDGTP